MLREALGAEIFPPAISDSTLVDFILTAARIAYPNAHPPSIPARVRKAVEARPPSSVYLATTDEQQEYLSQRHRPYLRVSEEQAADLAEAVGCRRFEESFAFSMLVEGQQESERIIDVYPGLRGTLGADKVAHATVARALLLAKRVTTEDGVEDQSLDWHLDGANLVVANEADERRVLGFVNEAFELRLDNAELAAVLKAGLDHRLEALRQEAHCGRRRRRAARRLLRARRPARGAALRPVAGARSPGSGRRRHIGRRAVPDGLRLGLRQAAAGELPTGGLP